MPLNMDVTLELMSPFLCVYLRETLAQTPKETCLRKLTAALLLGKIWFLIDDSLSEWDLNCGINTWCIIIFAVRINQLD